VRFVAFFLSREGAKEAKERRRENTVRSPSGQIFQSHFRFRKYQTVAIVLTIVAPAASA
jgi:hypothetical protein